jgi:hypothetical protein
MLLDLKVHVRIKVTWRHVAAVIAAAVVAGSQLHL